MSNKRTVMKKNIIISLALIGGFALLAASCVKEIVSNDEKYRPAGTPITITASTSYENGAETRAEYSGELYGTSSRYERIDWVEEDPIRIVYNGTPADYKVADGTIHESNEISEAGLTGNLEWSGSGNHEFYALYPSGNGAAGSLSNTGYVTGTIPPVQNVTSKTISKTETINGTSYTYDKYQPDTEHYGYLASYELIDASSTASSVELHFKPAFTTFEFKFIRNAGDPNPTIMSAELETEEITVGGETVHTPLTGNFGFQILGKTTDGRGARWNKALTGSDCTTLSGTLGYKITVGFGDSGVTIPDNGVLDFSFLALPIDLNGVKITLNYAGGTKKVLRLKEGTPGNLTWHPFEGARKYVITNMMPSEWIYVLEQIDDFEFTGHNAVSGIGFNVISYKYPAGDPSNKIAVPWHIEYSDGSSYGTNASTYSHEDFMLSDLPGSASGLGSITGEARASNIIRPNPNYNSSTSPSEDISRDTLQHRTPKGSSGAPYDLSMHDIHGNARPTQTTANSYVVSAPGWYKFPVVYGNAITNGADNKSAYDPYAAGAPLNGHWNWVWNDAAGPDKTNNDVYMTEHFLNAKNNPITSPYVLVDVPASDPQAVLVWQDTQVGDEIIKYGADDLKLVGSGSSAYIQFYIDKDNIHQGNIVLAVRDGNNEEVLWSWQIWVCEKDLNPITSRQMMPYNLGWIDEEGLELRTYTNRVNHYRIVQSESGKIAPFKITQIGDEDAIPNNTGYNTFYQWGRKDPITSAAVAGRTSQAYASQLNAWPATRLHEFPNQDPTGDGHSPSYAFGITHPWIPTQDSDNGGWVNGQFYPPHKTFWHTDFRRGTAPNPESPDVNPVDGVPDNYDPSNPTALVHTGNIERKRSGCPFNLWNAYAYSSDDFSGSEKKYKTVYDPCPPGFCVPTLGTFASIESAIMERDPDKGINFIFPNGDAFFLPCSGSRGTRYTGYIVNDRPDRGVYWVDAPSNVGKSKFYVNGKWYRRNEYGTLVENNCNAQHGLGFFWYMFAKSLHIYNELGQFPDEEAHSSYVKYTPEDVHWDTMTPAHGVGAYPQTQRTGFDDSRSNAFSIRPIVDPRY